MSDTASAPVSNLWYKKNSGNDYYRVRRSDTLYSIAWMFGLDYRALARVNSLRPPYCLRVGEKIKMTHVPIGDYTSQKVFLPDNRHISKSRNYRNSHGQVKALHSGVWVWPARGKIISGYKKGYAENTGINIRGYYREPVFAAASGNVVYCGTGVRGYGNLIIIKHNSSYLSAYAYNDSIVVRLGQRVKAGQKIALMGKNNAGEVMLHFEVRENGLPVNPMRFLR